MFTDRGALTSRAYADHRALGARLSIYRWQVDRFRIGSQVGMFTCR